MPKADTYGSTESTGDGRQLSSGSSETGVLRLPEQNIPTKTTAPDQALWHWISDEQFQMLKDANRDGLVEAMWGLTGIASGALLPSLEIIYGAFINEPAEPISGWSLIIILSLAVPAALAIGIYIVGRARGKRAQNIFDQIEKRQQGKNVSGQLPNP